MVPSQFEVRNLTKATARATADNAAAARAAVRATARAAACATKRCAEATARAVTAAQIAYAADESYVLSTKKLEAYEKEREEANWQLVKELEKFTRMAVPFDGDSCHDDAVETFVYNEKSWGGGAVTALPFKGLIDLNENGEVWDKGGDDHTLMGRTEMKSHLERQGFVVSTLPETLRFFKEKFAHMEKLAIVAGYKNAPRAGVWKTPPLRRMHDKKDDKEDRDEDQDMHMYRDVDDVKEADATAAAALAAGAAFPGPTGGRSFGGTWYDVLSRS